MKQLKWNYYFQMEMRETLAHLNILQFTLCRLIVSVAG